MLTQGKIIGKENTKREIAEEGERGGRKRETEKSTNKREYKKR